MANVRVGGWWPGLRTLVEAGTGAGLSDGELLDRFARGEGPAAEAAFAVLVERHGPMVLRACRAALRDEHAAEDACQATFLVLALKAEALARAETIAPWLYRVAGHVARRARAASERRRRHEHRHASRASSLVEAPSEASREVAAILHEEVARLPAWCRAPVVLCHLEGRTCEEAARALGVPAGTVKSRLARARDRLRARLSDRGLAPAVATAALATASAARAAVPPRLAATAAWEAVAFAHGPSPGVASRAVVLALETRRMQAMTRILSIASGVAAATLVGLGFGLGLGLGLGLSRPSPSAPPPPPSQAVRAPVPHPRAHSPQPAARVTVAPRLVSATAGRGEARLFALDARGLRIAEPDRPPRPASPKDRTYKEETRPLRWAIVIGTADFRSLREAFPGPPPPREDSPFWPSKRIDLERQALRGDGNWSDWAPVDMETNYRILDNFTEIEAERVPPGARPEALVDPLPFLTSGEWRGVDVESLVDPKLRDVPRRAIRTDAKVPTVPADEVMVRAIDFTVEPGTTYRYRARIVVSNPARRPREANELEGPWSEPTGAVAIPKD